MVAVFILFQDNMDKAIETYFSSMYGLEHLIFVKFSFKTELMLDGITLNTKIW